MDVNTIMHLQNCISLVSFCKITFKWIEMCVESGLKLSISNTHMDQDLFFYTTFLGVRLTYRPEIPPEPMLSYYQMVNKIKWDLKQNVKCKYFAFEDVVKNIAAILS